ncbi:MAG: cupredoxin domain-containing protein [Burkholderiales bacterium]|nr:cupredoxin domain-containing protein [Burkholderiales bacterium]
MKPGRHVISICSTCIALAVRTAASAPAAGQDPAYTIAIKAHRFVPATLTIPAGTRVRIVLDNQGATAEEFDSHALNREKQVPPLSRASVFVGPLDPGRYIFESDESDAPGGPALGIIEAR